MMTIEDIADTPGISADSFSEPADRCGIQAIWEKQAIFGGEPAPAARGAESVLTLRPGQPVLVFAFTLFDAGYFPFWSCIFKQYVAIQLR
jgi:hypothetical protein